MKTLIFTLLLIFSTSVYAKTYYCTQTRQTTVYFNEESVRTEPFTGDILKVELDLKNDKVNTKDLGKKPLNVTVPYKILKKYDLDDRLYIYASNDEDSVRLESLVFSYFKNDDEINNNFRKYCIKYYTRSTITNF